MQQLCLQRLIKTLRRKIQQTYETKIDNQLIIIYFVFKIMLRTKRMQQRINSQVCLLQFHIQNDLRIFVKNQTVFIIGLLHLFKKIRGNIFLFEITLPMNKNCKDNKGQANIITKLIPFQIFLKHPPIYFNPACPPLFKQQKNVAKRRLKLTIKISIFVILMAKKNSVSCQFIVQQYQIHSQIKQQKKLVGMQKTAFITQNCEKMLDKNGPLGTYETNRFGQILLLSDV